MAAGNPSGELSGESSRRQLLPRPLVIAHRGFSWVAPENTLASYGLALDAGAQLFECDVWLSADGVPVVFHDENLERITGVAGRVSDTLLDDLRKLDAGKWKDASFSEERIPTLAELLEWVQSHSKPSNALGLVIEIKQDGMAAAALEAIRMTGTSLDTITILGFDVTHLEDLVGLEPRLRCIGLQDDVPGSESARGAILEKATSVGLRGVGTSVEQFDPEFVAQAHSMGLPIYVWTANEPDDMRKLFDGGVDALISDRPDLALQIRDERFPEASSD
jgi:glycerophosphoryl diester phosphodiesterase